MRSFEFSRTRCKEREFSEPGGIDRFKESCIVILQLCVALIARREAFAVIYRREPDRSQRFYGEKCIVVHEP